MPSLSFNARRKLPRSSRILFAVAAALGLAAFLLVRAELGRADQARRAAGPMAAVVVAARDIAAGAAIGPGDVRTTSIPQVYVPPEAVPSLETAIGLVSAAPVRAGEVLVGTRLSASGFGALLAPGDVAVTVGATSVPAGITPRPGRCLRDLRGGPSLHDAGRRRPPRARDRRGRGVGNGARTRGRHPRRRPGDRTATLAGGRLGHDRARRTRERHGFAIAEPLVLPRSDAGAGLNSRPVTIWQAIVLGIVQGITEFAPVSSSGHLILVPWALGWTIVNDPALNKTFDVALHMGTLLGAVIYFWRDLWSYVKAFVASCRARTIRTTEERMAWAIVIGTIPDSSWARCSNR